MPLFGKAPNAGGAQNADTSDPINATVTNVASDVVTVPNGKKGMVVSLWNDGPSAVRIAFDVTATPTTGIVLNPGEGYADGNLAIAARISAISLVTGQDASMRGIMWSG